jgi:Transposase DDE domain
MRTPDTRARWGHFRRIAASRSRPIVRSCTFACPTYGCAGRGNGMRAGWPSNCGASYSWIASGPIGCRRTARARWDQVLQVLVSYRLIAPGSEWELHRDWFGRSAMADLLGSDFRLAEPHKLYACHDFLLKHKADLFTHLVGRWRDLFNVDFDVLLYDLISTYFEINTADVPEGDECRHGYSRDKRPDCPQVVITLVVTPDGLPLAYEVLPGNTADCKTLRMFLDKIEPQYGRARRVWIMDRGIPTEAVPAEMRASDPPMQYLVGTPKGRRSRLEKDLLAKPWQQAREGVQVKLLAVDSELYVFAESVDRVTKERTMRRRQLKWLWKRLRELAAMEISREEMLMEFGGDAVPCAHDMAPGRDRHRQGEFHVHLHAQPPEAAQGASTRRTVFAAHEPHRERSRAVVVVLHPVCRPGTSVQESEGRPGDPPGLPSGRAPDRSSYLHRIPGLLPAGHATAPPARLG